jgi:hypothetical protein
MVRTRAGCRLADSLRCSLGQCTAQTTLPGLDAVHRTQLRCSVVHTRDDPETHTSADSQSEESHRNFQAGGRGAERDRPRQSSSGPQPSRWFLTLGPGKDKEHHSAYKLHDLFIICRNATFCGSRLEPVSFARSLWHGPGSDNTLEVDWRGVSPALQSNKEVPVFVIRGPAACSALC